MGLEKGIILIIEDEKEIAEELGEFLETYNFRVVYARTVSEALLKCQNQIFDIILTDINLEKGSAEKVIVHLRDFPNEKNHKTPIVIISSAVSQELMGRVRSSVNWIFVKPYSLKGVKEKVMEILNLK